MLFFFCFTGFGKLMVPINIYINIFNTLKIRNDKKKITTDHGQKTLNRLPTEQWQ